MIILANSVIKARAHFHSTSNFQHNGKFFVQFLHPCVYDWISLKPHVWCRGLDGTTISLLKYSLSENLHCINVISNSTAFIILWCWKIWRSLLSMIFKNILQSNTMNVLSAKFAFSDQKEPLAYEQCLPQIQLLQP